MKAHSQYEEGPYYDNDEHGAAISAADTIAAQIGDTVAIWEGDSSPVDWASYARSFYDMVECAADDDVYTEHFNEPMGDAAAKINAAIEQAVRDALAKFPETKLERIDDVRKIELRVTSVDPFEYERITP